MNIYILLYYEFFKIGLFAFGGGYAALPFLYYIAEKYDWYSVKELTNMIAISNITPGPIGINMATFAGNTTAGIIGGLIATLAIVTPSFIIVFLIIKLLKKYKDNTCMIDIFSGLRPAACAMISAVGIKLFLENIVNTEINNYFIINPKELFLFTILLLFVLKSKKSPTLILLLGAVFGIILNIKNIGF